MAANSLIFRIDANDEQRIVDFDPASTQTTVVLMDLLGVLGHGIGDTLASLQAYGLEPTEAAVDLVILASAVYAADKQFSRWHNSQDSWTREFNLHVPVSDVDIWYGVTARLETALHFLTGDLWRLRFHHRAQDNLRLVPAIDQPPLILPDCVSLFSGGLDSFIGAIDLLAERRRPILVSHGWVTSDIHHQKECVERLNQAFGVGEIRRVSSRIGFHNEQFGVERSRENSERSRSFLFFSLAGLVASALAPETTIYVPENGLISLNIPLDPLRLGSLSTRTTHPYFLSRFNEILQAVGIRSHLENPYRHKTKGEMMRECLNQDVLLSGFAETISCSSANKARWVPEAERPENYEGQCHCGWCVPCIIRRAAIRAAGVADPTIYLLADIEHARESSMRARGMDIRSFQIAIDRLNNCERRARAIIRETGPLSDFPDEIESFAQMYLRGMREVENLIGAAVIEPDV